MKRFRSMLATFLAGAMTISMITPTMAADSQLVQTFQFEKPDLLEVTENSNQTASKEETVYVSSINPNTRSNDINENWLFYLGETNGAEVRLVKAPAPGTDISAAQVVVDSNYDYTGEPIEAQPTVTFNSTPLEYGIDFTIDDVATIESYEEVRVTTLKNVAPVLPETVMAKMSVGPDKKVKVNWDAIDPSKYASTGDFVAQGTVEGYVDEQGNVTPVATTVKPTATVTVIEATSAETVVTTTIQNYKPVLPRTVIVYFNDGTNKECPVAWNAMNNSDFAAADTTVTVNGTADLGDGQTIATTASITVIAGTPSTNNWAVNTTSAPFPKAFSSHCTTDYASFINDGNESWDNTSSQQIWSD